MIERIIEIAETSARLHLENGLAVVSVAGERPVTVPVGEIGCLLIANPAITITGALLAALAENHAIVVISDTKRLPVAMQLPLQGNVVQTERFQKQLNVPLPLKKQLWKTTVKAKIRRQSNLLIELHGDDCGLLKLVDSVRSGDPENMEAQAARIYWKRLFGDFFLRDREADDANLMLNYGYVIIRALVARACCAVGLHPSLGINHHNRYDIYCLADDLMEPFRPIVDKCVHQLNPHNDREKLTKEIRQKLLSLPFEKQATSSGHLALGDCVNLTARSLLQSFLTGENCLTFD